MNKLFTCKILYQPLLHSVFLPDGLTYELEAVAKLFENKTKSQLLCPSNRAPIAAITYAYDVKHVIDELYHNASNDQQNQGEKLEPRYVGYETYTKDDYLIALTHFLNQQDPYLRFKLPSKLQAPVDYADIDESIVTLGHERFFPRPVSPIRFRGRALANNEMSCEALRVVSWGAVSTTAFVSALFVSLILANRGEYFFNINFKEMVLQAKKDIANNCSYNPMMFQNNPVPLEPAYHINWTAALSGGAFSCAFLVATYRCITDYGATGKTQLLAYALVLMGILTIALAALNQMNEKIWMAFRGQVAGYNSKYTYDCYKSALYQHCRNVTPAECTLGFNGIPESFYAPSENEMNFIDAGESPFHFFAGAGAFATLLILNGICIAVLFAIAVRKQCCEVNERGGEVNEPLNINDEQEVLRRGYGAV